MSGALVALRGITKRFGGATALRDVSLELLPGSAHALVGENGAGKSTLVKILAGAIAPTQGTVEIAGRVLPELTPSAAHALGIRVVHQEFALIGTLSIAENLFFGAERTRFRFLPDRRWMRARAQELLDQLGVPLDADTSVERLSVGQKQIVEIAKGLCFSARIFVLDEPTAPLTPTEVKRLFQIVRELKQRGVALLYISHRLHEVFDLCEQVTVLRDGAVVHCGAVKDLTRTELVHHMAGRALTHADEAAPPHHPKRKVGNVRLRVSGLSTPSGVQDVSFHVRAGETIGLAGLIGAGRTETLRAVFGADGRTQGTIEFDGSRIAPNSPAQAVAFGLGLLPEDRATQGILKERSVAENCALAVLPRLSRLGVLTPARMHALAQELAPRLNLRAPSLSAPLAALSGGNQQKVVLARWLAAKCGVLLLDEPTRGIDVAARQEIYQLLRDLARDGHALVIASSSLPELFALTDRLYVFREGRLAGELVTQETSAQEVLALAAR